MFEWVQGNAFSLLVTLYPGNITLNNSAASYFQDVRWVMVGLDKENKRLGIKPVTKREIDLNLVSMNNLIKISIGKGYARISNKLIIQEVSDMIGKEVDGLKLPAEYDEKENMLIVEIKSII